MLTYVSGLSKASAQEIVKYRDANGKITSRSEIKNVKKIGPKTYEQAIGFLRISEPIEKLDMTSIHPESYDKARAILNYIGLTEDAIGSKEIKDAVSKLDKKELLKEIEIDEYTLNDICEAFVQPLRDIRDEYPTPILRSDILHFEDLKPGDELEGTVRNVIDFGCFVDCGVKYDGLLHISKMHKTGIKHPSELLSVGDLIKVKVLDVDYDHHKLQLELLN